MTMSPFATPNATEMPPLEPSGTIAALATVCPLKKSIVDTPGYASPVVQIARKPSVVVSVATTFKDTAVALTGIPQTPVNE
jgi:hypothetical protein